MYRKNKKQLKFSKLLLLLYSSFLNIFTLTKKKYKIYPILFLIIFVLICIKWDVIKNKIFKKSFENMDNKNDKCCTVETDNTFNNPNIAKLANKAIMSNNKLCCDNPDLAFCDC